MVNKTRMAMDRAILSLALMVTMAVMQSAVAETYVQLVQRMGSSGSFQPAVEELLRAKLNAFRASQGLNILAQDDSMTRAARAHANDMATHNFMGHTASTGQDFDSRMRALHNGAMVISSMGENAAMMFAPSSASVVAERLFQEWLNSSPHRHTMVSRDYIMVSTGVVIVNGKAYADQIFSGPPVISNMMRAQ